MDNEFIKNITEEGDNVMRILFICGNGVSSGMIASRTGKAGKAPSVIKALAPAPETDAEGKVAKVKDFAQKIAGLKGVKFSKLVEASIPSC